MTTSSSDTWADAVQRARGSTLRVEAGRCQRQSAIVLEPELLVSSQRGLHERERVAVYDDTGTRYDAELVGSDDALDVALLRVSGAPFRPLPVADHAALRVGQFALALGRPGVQIRASLRIVGLLSGELQTPSGARLDRYIESDRGLPDGFEGGPLIDQHGALIGMNSSHVLRGSDLSVPHATLARCAAELLTHGRVRRGYLGVSCQPVRLPSELRSTLGQRSGALVLDTEEGSPARSAGLTLGDVIVSLDGTAIRGPRELSAALRDKRGAALSLGILRNGRPETIQVTAAENR